MLEKPFEQGGEKKRLTPEEATEATKELREKMGKLLALPDKAENEALFNEFYNRLLELSGKIKKNHPDHDDYAAYHVLAGSSVGSQGCKVIDFPEPELSVISFINTEYDKIFSTENSQQKKLFSLLGLKEEGLFIDPDHTRKFFEICGIDSIKKIDNTVYISCYDKEDSERYRAEETNSIMLGGGGHTNIENADYIIERVKGGMERKQWGEPEETLSQEIKLTSHNYEVGWLLIVAFGFQNILKRSELLKNENNKIEVFMPWSEKDSNCTKRDVLYFYQDLAAEKSPQIKFILGEDELRKKIFEE